MFGPHDIETDLPSTTAETKPILEGTELSGARGGVYEPFPAKAATRYPTVSQSLSRRAQSLPQVGGMCGERWARPATDVI